VVQKDLLAKKLSQFSFVEKVYPSDANFILMKVKNANALYDYLAAKGIVIRNRSKDVLCENCLRITIGTPEENELLIADMEFFMMNK
jgi:histidinol-phosphate aminotransferase